MGCHGGIPGRGLAQTRGHGRARRRKDASSSSSSVPAAGMRVGTKRCRAARSWIARASRTTREIATDGAVGHWALASLNEAEATALGVEIRIHSVKAAIVDVKTGSFLRPGASVRIQTCDAASVANALQRLTREFAWSGPVGCSITIAVAKCFGVDSGSFTVMGNEVGKILKKFLPRNPLVTMVHTEAAGYAELSFAQHSSGIPSRRQLVLVCTLGKNLGVVLYNDGHRVRNLGMNKSIARFGEERETLEKRFEQDWRTVKNAMYPVPPWPIKGIGGENGGDGVKLQAWDEYVRLIDRYLMQITDYVKPDTIILMPTGAYTVGPIVESMIPELKVPAESVSKPAVLPGSRAVGALVKGAAVGVLVELKAQEALKTLRQAVGQDIMQLQNLTTEQLRAAFDYFDEDGDGMLTEEKLETDLQKLGSSLSPDLIEQRLSRIRSSVKGQVTFDEFRFWWDTTIKQAPVTLITSEAEWLQILDNPFPDLPEDGGKNAPVVLEVGFSFCKPCKRFEPKYEAYALTHKDVRFVRINGNENENTIAFTKEKLQVRKTPSFFIFQNKKQVNSWTGANEEIFRANLFKFTHSQ
mmetsp:Transcript_7378/g.18927  ORF Transcript_7378/g.18927 Transcript_7378/m.18927 type:complete len:583 (-) Transcript_7378:1056-2804(-)